MRLVAGSFALSLMLTSCAVAGTAEPHCPSGTLNVQTNERELGDFVALQNKVRDVVTAREVPITMREIGRRAGWSPEWDRMIPLRPGAAPEKILAAAGIDDPNMCVKGIPTFDPFYERVHYPNSLFLVGSRPVHRVEWFRPQPLIDFGAKGFLTPDTELIIDRSMLTPAPGQ
ncbi:hypothetical protein [Nocardia sp. NPDC050413]|uniref:hypothetical protein n=1 Tax=Nocardia TaxID=1817 RepID=UPI0033CD0099